MILKNRPSCSNGTIVWNQLQSNHSKNATNEGEEQMKILILQHIRKDVGAITKDWKY